MKVERTDLDALTAELKLVIEKSDYLPEYEKQLKSYQQKAQLKGFRKGKTPIGLIKKMYGTATMQESVSKILGEKLNEIISGDEYNIIGEPYFLDEENAPEIDHTMPSDYTYRFEIGLEPEIEVQGAGEGDSYTKYKVEIDKEAIDEEMEIALERLGTQKEVEGPVKEKDIVYLDINEEVDGQAIETSFSVSYDKLTPTAEKKLKGLKTGDKAELDIYDLEAGMNDEDVVKYFLKMDVSDEAVSVPAKKVFNTTVSKITRLEKAEMDKEFFDKYFGEGQVSSEEEARDKIKSFLQDHFDREAVNLLNREIMNKLVETNQFDLPEGFLKKWISREQEMSDEQFDAFIQEMKWRVIKKKLVNKHDVKVEEKEILDYFVQMIRNYSPYIDEATLKNTVFSLMKNREQVNRAVEAVSSGKLFDAIREVITIEEADISRKDFTDKVEAINKSMG